MTQEKDAERLRRVLALIGQAVDELEACEATPIIERAKRELAQQGLSLFAWGTPLEALVRRAEEQREPAISEDEEVS